MIYYQYQTILTVSSPSKRKLNSKVHSLGQCENIFKKMLFVLAYVTVSYIAANKCATYKVNIIFKSRRSITSKGKIASVRSISYSNQDDW